MNEMDSIGIDDRWIRAYRGLKNRINTKRPYAFSIEEERTREGFIEKTATVFLTNKECPFTCLMCDLWKNTSDFSVSTDDITEQLDWVLPQISQASHIKIYNSGNFFDTKSIPVDAYPWLYKKLEGFKTLIVECHPLLIDERCLAFRDKLKPELQVAIGLETVNPGILSILNKGMTLENFEGSVRFLTSNNIQVRAFILLRPPFQDEDEGIKWAKRSLDFAFNCGVECCVIIPTRAGNGSLDLLKEKGYFQQPLIESLEEVLEYGIKLKGGRVFADLWDLEKFSNCDLCFSNRESRLREMNLHQVILDKTKCNCHIIR
jgi:radical SAM enzyme (TIGR01210 family)